MGLCPLMILMDQQGGKHDDLRRCMGNRCILSGKYKDECDAQDAPICVTDWCYSRVLARWNTCCHPPYT